MTLSQAGSVFRVNMRPHYLGVQETRLSEGRAVGVVALPPLLAHFPLPLRQRCSKLMAPSSDVGVKCKGTCIRRQSLEPLTCAMEIEFTTARRRVTPDGFMEDA